MKHFLLLLLIAGLFSCNKDDDDTDKTPTRTETLSNKKWQLTTVTSGTTDVFAILPDYYKDDYIQLNSDMTYELNANTNKEPGTTESVLDTGTWELQNNDQTIVLHSNNSTGGSLLSSLGNLQITELTDTKLTVTGTLPTTVGLPVALPVTATFKPI